MPDQTRHQVNLLDFFAFLLRWRKLILTASFGVAIVVAVITFIVPERYRCFSVVRSNESSEEGIGSLVASKLGALAGLAGATAGMGDTYSEVALSILRSRWMSERVIERFDLRTVYKVKTGPIEDVIKALGSNSYFEIDDESSNIVIAIDDRDPRRAKEMADYFVELLDQRNRELRSFTAHSERVFIGQRLDEERFRLSTLEDSLYRFQVETGVLDITEQTKATIQAAATLESQRYIAAAELELKRQILGVNNPETQYVSLRLASIDSSLQGLVRSRDQNDHDFLLSLQDIPAQGLAYVRLMRDIEVEQLLVAYLLQQYEQAKISELRSTPTIIQVDPAAIPTKKHWPKRALITIAAFAAAFVFSTALAMLLEMFQGALTNIDHPQHERLRRILESWKSGS